MLSLFFYSIYTLYYILVYVCMLFDLEWERKERNLGFFLDQKGLMGWQCCLSVFYVIENSYDRSTTRYQTVSWKACTKPWLSVPETKTIFISLNVCLHTRNCVLQVNSWKQIREIFFDLHKNSYSSNNLHLYITPVCCLYWQTKMLFICNLLCSRAKTYFIWKIVLKAKLLDFAILFVLDQRGIMKHLPSDQ